MSETTFVVIDHDNDNERTAETRQEAEKMAETAREFGSEHVEIRAPNDNRGERETDGGSAEVVEAEPVTPDPDPETEPATPEQAEELPERSVADDPIAWMPSDFVDQIDGTPAVNRKGFEVLSHFYDISVHADLEAKPEDHAFEYCRVKATATTADGRECEAYGSAHVDRGDDPELLLEMADTRARKRALSIATGVGAVAVEELKNEVDR